MDCSQERLTNAKRHGHTTHIHMKIIFNKESILLQIKDNGVGTDSLNLRFGLQTMKDRITSLSGSLIIESD